MQKGSVPDLLSVAERVFSIYVTIEPNLRASLTTFDIFSSSCNATLCTLEGLNRQIRSII